VMMRVARQETTRKREQFFDRGAGTLLDGYNVAKMVELVQFCWRAPTGTGSQKRQLAESFLRPAADFLINHNMLLCGESRQQAEIFTLATTPAGALPNQGPTPCWPMILLIDNGKTNQYGRAEYMGVMQHRDPLLCTMSQLAFYLFCCWNIESLYLNSGIGRVVQDTHLQRGLWRQCDVLHMRHNLTGRTACLLASTLQ
jgi:Centromere DNA-binding protein complex CBF3 subunit, domain 2